MEYTIYKLEFQTGAHFGTGALDEGSYTFHADQLFSAMYIEAMKLGKAQRFYEMVKTGDLLFSDALPYIDKQYLVPKPMVYVQTDNQGESKQKKAYKKLKYFPVEKIDEFLTGNMNLETDPMKGFGQMRQQTMAHVRSEDDTLPYRVGTFYYAPGCGLYVVIAYKSNNELSVAEELLEALSYTGIGGKKTSGMGKFNFRKGKPSKELEERLCKKSTRSMLISVALPKEVEINQAMENASYLLEKRTGFVASIDYALEWRKKNDLYVFTPGSCFTNRFSGDIYDVSNGGNHAVYRYAKALFLGV
mgnify:FL=1